MLISGLMRTYNEADNLPISLPNWVRFCDEVVISDGGSTDGTREVAESIAGDKLVWLDFPGGSIHNRLHQNHAGKQLNYGLDRCQGEWVITHDADTIFCDRFVKDIRGILAEAQYPAYAIFGIHIIDDWQHYNDWWLEGPGVTQVFRRDSGVRFPDSPEEAAFVEGINKESIGVLKLGAFHWGYMDRDAYREKLNHRLEVFKDDDHLLEVFTLAMVSLQSCAGWDKTAVPWPRCHAECASCWMVERARQRQQASWE